MIIQKLCKTARAYGLPAVPDTAGRTKVEGMHQSILAHVGVSPTDLQGAIDAFASYCVSFGDDVAAAAGAQAPAVVAQTPRRRWKFKAAQFTYNSTEGEWASTDSGVLEGLFRRLVQFVQSLSTLVRTKGASVTLEESLKAGDHVHAHVYLHLDKEFEGEGDGGLDVFMFEGIRPHLVTNTAKGKGFGAAVNLGHFYVFADKKGTLFNWATYEPFCDYKVEAWWLDNLLKAGKIERAVYLRYASRVGIGFQRRLADINAAERHEKEQAMVEHVDAESAGLMRAIKPVKFFQVIEAFLKLFTEEHHRRPILAIVGGTNLGKTMLARDVLRRVAAVVGVAGFLEVTVELNTNLDFSELDTRVHGGVLLDGVGDALILKANRESLQGQAKLCKGGQSATMMYSYKFTLARRAVVATFDLSAENLDALGSDHWLSNELNVMQLQLTESAFDNDAPPRVDLHVPALRIGCKRIRL